MLQYFIYQNSYMILGKNNKINILQYISNDSIQKILDLKRLTVSIARIKST